MLPLTVDQIDFMKSLCLKVMESNRTPVLSEEAKSSFDFGECSLDEMIFSFSTALAIDYPEFGQEENGVRALKCITLFNDFLIKLIQEFEQKGMSHEVRFNPSTLFYNWVRIAEEQSGIDGSVVDPGGQDDRREVAGMDRSRRKH
jgi:hypothetical protein